MSGITTRKSYTKIKNFTEKDQVRVKYSYIGKDKKLMLSVYIGEEVYKTLTGGHHYERLKVEYIPNDMVVITPTDNEKEGIVHRYNGKGLFKTTCVRLSLSSYKKLKIRKKDFNNRVVEFDIWKDHANIYGCNKLNVNLIGSKKPRFVNKVDENDIVLQSYVYDTKPLEIRALTEDKDDTCMFVSHHFLNDVRDTIENRLLDMEERFEKRIKEQEDYFLKKFETHITGTFATRLNILEENVKFLSNAVEINVSATSPKELDIDTLKQLFDKITDTMNFKLSKVESGINELESRVNCLKAVDTEYMSYRFSEIKDLLNEIKKSHENKSLFERIFGKD